jgi:hypothetical protein
MPLYLTIFLAIVLPLTWNIATVLFLVRKDQKQQMTPVLFTSVFVFGFSFTLSMILFIAITVTRGIDIKGIGFVGIVFVLTIVVSYPVVYYLSSRLLKIRYTKQPGEK